MTKIEDLLERNRHWAERIGQATGPGILMDRLREQACAGQSGRRSSARRSFRA